MTRRILILQHVPWERPALLGDILSANDIPWTLDNVSAAHDRSALPRLDDLAGVAILGGPMGALNVDRHPGLGLEAALVREAIDADIPLLGVCLGHQIIATALGAALHPGAAAEFGVGDVIATTDDPLFGTAGTTRPVLHWHGNVVEAPDGATVLARTDQTPNQAFRLGDAVFTAQFHVEVDRRMLGEWLAVPEMASDLSGNIRSSIEDDFVTAEDRMRELADTLFGAFATAALARG